MSDDHRVTALRAAFGQAVKYAGLRMKEECEATFPVFDEALDSLAAELVRVTEQRDEALRWLERRLVPEAAEAQDVTP